MSDRRWDLKDESCCQERPESPLVPSSYRMDGRRLFWRPVCMDPMSLVDPEFREPLRENLRTADELTWGVKTLEKLRAEWGTTSLMPNPPFVDRLISAAHGAPDVREFVINGEQGDVKKPAILCTHGGGFVRATAASGIPTLQRVASKHDCAIVTVDYRLAPETHFPGSLEDDYSALKWLHASAGMLGVDPARIAMMGESASGVDYAKRLIDAGVPTQLCVVPGGYHGFDLIAPLSNFGIPGMRRWQGRLQ
jgi:acetyl esterase/lipase